MKFREYLELEEEYKFKFSHIFLIAGFIKLVMRFVNGDLSFENLVFDVSSLFGINSHKKQVEKFLKDEKNREKLKRRKYEILAHSFINFVDNIKQ